MTAITVLGALVAGPSSARAKPELLPARSVTHNALSNGLFIGNSSKINSERPSIDGLTTGFNLNSGKPWLYYRRTHVGATAWFILAELGVNPFWQGSQVPE